MTLNLALEGVSSASCCRYILPQRKEPPTLTKHEAGWTSHVSWR